MSQEPVEVEVLDKDEAPLAVAEEKKHSLANPINVLMLFMAILAAAGILLMAFGNALQDWAEKKQKELPPEPEE